MKASILEELALNSASANCESVSFVDIVELRYEILIINSSAFFYVCVSFYFNSCGGQSAKEFAEVNFSTNFSPNGLSREIVVPISLRTSGEGLWADRNPGKSVGILAVRDGNVFFRKRGSVGNFMVVHFVRTIMMRQSRAIQRTIKDPGHQGQQDI